MKNILQRLLPGIVKIRQQIHAYPELAHKEVITAQLIKKTLTEFGYQVQDNIAETGLTTILDSGIPGKTVALRADIDALPIQEETQLSYRSQVPGVMHACGHDGHTATLLATAGVLRECTSQFRGKIKFIFQPAEEAGTGASRMISEGVLENPKVDAIFGYHNTPRSQFGIFKSRAGCIHAAKDVFSVVIHGKGGHAGQPHITTDPIYLGSLLVQSIQGIVSRLTLPTDALVVSVTQFHSGTTHNAIPDEAFLNGTIRCISPTRRALVKQQLKQIVEGIVATYGATATVTFSNSFPPTINSLAETELAFSTARRVLGANKVEELQDCSMAAEDFSYYLEKVPGCFFWIGTGLETLNMHSTTYEFNDDVIPLAAEIMGQVAIDYLNQK